MDKSNRKIFNDKVSLVYEYNKQSPLFVRMANIEIENNNLDAAIEILSAGIRLYPEYAVAHFVLGKAYTLIGSYKLALSSIKTGAELICSPKTYEFYLREIENIKKQRTLFETSRGSIFLSKEEDYPDVNQQDLFDEALNGSDLQPDTEEENEELARLAREISQAKIPFEAGNSDQDDISFNDGTYKNVIASETLAKIYISQGEINEAITVFENLKLKYPDKKDYYDEQITGLMPKQNNE